MILRRGTAWSASVVFASIWHGVTIRPQYRAVYLLATVTVILGANSANGHTYVKRMPKRSESQALVKTASAMAAATDRKFDLLSLGTFVVLGLPDGILGTAWPAMRHSFGAPVGALGLICSSTPSARWRWPLSSGG